MTHKIMDRSVSGQERNKFPTMENFWTEVQRIQRLFLDHSAKEEVYESCIYERGHHNQANRA